MKSRFNNILAIITAVTFVAALTINIQASFNDPFVGMSDANIALTTTGDETTGTEGFLMCEFMGPNLCQICEPNPSEQCNVSAQCCCFCEPLCTMDDVWLP